MQKAQKEFQQLDLFISEIEQAVDRLRAAYEAAQATKPRPRKSAPKRMVAKAKTTPKPKKARGVTVKKCKARTKVKAGISKMSDEVRNLRARIVYLVRAKAVLAGEEFRSMFGRLYAQFTVDTHVHLKSIADSRGLDCIIDAAAVKPAWMRHLWLIAQEL